LGINYSMAIDMWSLGCILVELLTGRPIFPGKNEVDQMHAINNVLGSTPSHILAQACKNKIQLLYNDGEKGLELKPRVFDLPPPRTLETIIRDKLGHETELRSGVRKMSTRDRRPDVVQGDIDQFTDLVKQMLQMDPTRRIDAARAMTHPFFSSVIDTEPTPTSAQTPSAATDEDRAASASSTSSIPANIDVSPSRYYGYDRMPEPWRRNGTNE
jgi:dual specificity tyrosine-phosphorylation-regulated kinase 1